MLKTERHQKILNLCETHGIVSVKLIQDNLAVSDMTIRRDLKELADNEQLHRVHGGAQSLNYEYQAAEMSQLRQELSHTEKKQISTNEKNYIAKKAASIIQQTDESIFLGPGTTIELMTEFINISRLRVITNSLPVFNLLKEKDNFELHLIGGEYRNKTGAFVGAMAIEMLNKININKAFIGVNALQDDQVFTFNIEEGNLQQLVLEKATEKYLLADSQKFDEIDFYSFYKLSDVDALFTDSSLDLEVKKDYEQYTKIIN
ncbi:DeoR/GlpR family DNA-binding transcription regulator [Enterococcus eurekensis]|uniref:Lactose phosphotransferase system repressor n=1 Tax=Enterococcus eurekensis TaxID=1159753 RepID=A0ABV9M5G2_9ENTE